MKYLLNAAILALLVANGVAAQVPAETIPDFNFYTLNKTLFTSKNLPSGKKILFVFFDTDCDHCQHAMQYFSEHTQELKKAAVYLVTLDSPEKINRFMNAYGSKLAGKKNITILQDPQNEFLRRFRPRKYPSLFLYSSQKKLLRYDDNEKNISPFLQQINKPGQ